MLRQYAMRAMQPNAVWRSLADKQDTGLPTSSKGFGHFKPTTIVASTMIGPMHEIGIHDRPHSYSWGALFLLTVGLNNI